MGRYCDFCLEPRAECICDEDTLADADLWRDDSSDEDETLP